MGAHLISIYIYFFFSKMLGDSPDFSAWVSCCVKTAAGCHSLQWQRPIINPDLPSFCNPEECLSWRMCPAFIIRQHDCQGMEDIQNNPHTPLITFTLAFKPGQRPQSSKESQGVGYNIFSFFCLSA